MSLKRVVITGMGAVSPLGRGCENLFAALEAGRSGVVTVPDLGRVGGLRCRVAGLVPGEDGKEIPRRHRRSMSRMSILATLAAEEALLAAGLTPAAWGDGSTGTIFGSTVGSPFTMEGFFEDYLTDHSLERMKSTLFFQIMNHSCASNVAQALGLTGRLLAPSAACATGGQAVGYGYEAVAAGRQERVVCGGSDEFHPLVSGTFDVMNAASTAYNDAPTRTPRPFDRGRDGVVCAEGAGALVLESFDSARERNAPIWGEVVGFATVTDPGSIANPGVEAMADCMNRALDDAGLAAAEVDYVNAHATGTEQGDLAESRALARVLEGPVPVSSLKGHLGHTMAASGALELIACLQMMARGVLIPTLNLDDPDPACAPLDYLQEPRRTQAEVVMKNNFAMGGVNCCLLVRRGPG